MRQPFGITCVDGNGDSRRSPDHRHRAAAQGHRMRWAELYFRSPRLRRVISAPIPHRGQRGARPTTGSACTPRLRGVADVEMVTAVPDTAYDVRSSRCHGRRLRAAVQATPVSPAGCSKRRAGAAVSVRAPVVSGATGAWMYVSSTGRILTDSCGVLHLRLRGEPI